MTGACILEYIVLCLNSLLFFAFNNFYLDNGKTGKLRRGGRERDMQEKSYEKKYINFLVDFYRRYYLITVCFGALDDGTVPHLQLVNIKGRKIIERESFNVYFFSRSVRNEIMRFRLGNE